ncbi:MAG: hypothetical protein AABZ14_00050 [Candidatus Margulisiibacteriota bacterium]
MAITPIDLSALVNQRSDISKIAGDDFLRIQQQQLANVTQKEEADHQYATKEIDAGGEAKIDTEGKPQSFPREERREAKQQAETSEEPEDILENVEFVSYQDPDLGNALDWKG